MEETRASGSAQEMVMITMHRINEKYQSVNERLLVLREGHSLLGTFPPLMVKDYSNLVDNKDEGRIEAVKLRNRTSVQR